jgi:hypothetical protein
MYRMEKVANKKSDSFGLKIGIFLAKLPLLRRHAGVNNTTVKEKPESESIMERYKQDPNTLDGFSSPYDRYPFER